MKKTIALAVVAVLALTACGGSSEPELEAAPSATPTPTMALRDYQAEAQAIWDRAGSAERDQACGIEDLGWPEMGRNADDEVYAHLQVHVLPAECPARTEVAEAEAAEAEAKRKEERRRAEVERERQRKIDAMMDDSLTDDQKVSVYDAACEYLTTPGAEGDLVVLSDLAMGALGSESTPQQQWDATVNAGYLMGSGACR